ncbi:metal resistance protein ycf1, partial [Moniliophthora roreri]
MDLEKLVPCGPCTIRLKFPCTLDFPTLTSFFLTTIPTSQWLPTHSFSPSVWLFRRLKWNMVQAR